ncbi:MAG TPA: TRAP transporter small permease [Deltaproteobacteria bacterium]|nr:TRAP transporter small permease [Deltaproteobacteria bacterium]
MNTLNTLRGFIERIIRFSGTLGMIFVIPLMLITAGDVIGRSFFNKPIAGTFELSEYMLAIIILLGTAYTQQVKGHVAVDFLTSHFNKKTRLICQFITLFLSLLIVTIVVWQGLNLGIEEKGVTDQLRIPRAPFKILVGIGGLFLWFQIFFDLIDVTINFKKRK